MNNKYKICHISTAHGKFDDRIFYKECLSIAEHGFDVSCIVQSEVNETVNGVKILKLPIFKNRLYRMLINPLIATCKVLKNRYRIVHLHDPELLFVGICLKIFGKVVIYDMHELVYSQINDKDWISNRSIKRIISLIYQKLERISVHLFDRIILAEDGYKDYFFKNYKPYMNKVFFIRNFPILKLIHDSKAIKFDKNDKYIILYAGGLTKIRGIKEIVDALSYIDKPIEFWILGKFENDNYHNECILSPGWTKVKYIGHVNHSEVYSYILSCDIGISLLYPLPNYLSSLPVKAFEYMACEKPMIMSDFQYWEEVFKDVAVFCNPKDSKAIADSITSIICNVENAKNMGKKGRQLIIEKYSWESESQKLVDIYKQLAILKNGN